MALKHLYVFGNEYLKSDSFAKEMAEELKEKAKITFCTTPELLLDAEEEEIIILDVIKNVKETTVITDAAQLKINKLVSMHDFDVAYFLELMKQLGMLKKIKIIGVPESGDKKKIKEEIIKYL
jgi:Ni,Fe-hydrogenase maturation factor